MKTNQQLKGLLMILLTITLSSPKIIAQRTCGVNSHERYLKAKYPKRESKLLEYRKQLEKLTVLQKVNSAVSVTIPVVVHVVYNTAAQNISNVQILSQIAVLNQDFGRTNPDTTNTPAAFKPISANTNIQFCLAQRDPSNAPSTGIERRSTTITSFTTDDKVKFYSQGGLDIWDPTRFLNIWVCNMGGGLLGYGEFPTGSVSSTYGVVVQYNAFGNTGTVSAPFNLGRTTTHEFSHCFDLYHIWGDDGTACTGTDLCADTPNQAGATTGCFTFPKTDACSPASPGIMFMNYMDYSDDNCMNMFTNNQSTRMNNILNIAPYNTLKTSNGCTPVILATNDAGISAVVNPSGNSCNATFTPNVTLKNWGTSTLTSAFVKYRVDLTPLQTYTWTGSLGSLATITLNLPSQTASIGSHTFTAYSVSPNATTDGNNNNDTTKTVFSVIGVGQALPFVEGFEAVAFPPSGFSLNNPDAATTWGRTTTAAKLGVASARMDNFNYSSGSGQRDEMVLPAVDLTTLASSMLTFDLAYKLYTDPALNPNYSDTLQVLISTDCGATYSSIYKKFGANLTSTTPSWGNSAFVPTNMQWKSEVISLAGFNTVNNAIIKFRNISDYENYLYLDNINISGNVTGVKGTGNYLTNVSVYPNPSRGNIFVEYILLNKSSVSIKILDVVGREVYTFENNSQSAGNFKHEINASLQSGMYNFILKMGNETMTKKIIINK